MAATTITNIANEITTIDGTEYLVCDKGTTTYKVKSSQLSSITSVSHVGIPDWSKLSSSSLLCTITTTGETDRKTVNALNDGYLIFNSKNDSGDTGFKIYKNNIGIYSNTEHSSTTDTTYYSMPVSRGDTFEISEYANGTCSVYYIPFK